MSLFYTIKFDKYYELLVHNSDQESLPQKKNENLYFNAK